jgi:hypothetical protein
LKEAFRHKVGKHTYCAVETEVLLRQEKWQRFFARFRKQDDLLAVAAAAAAGEGEAVTT